MQQSGEAKIEIQMLYRMLPSVDALVVRREFVRLLKTHSRASIIGAARRCLAHARSEIVAGGHTAASLANLVESLAAAVEQAVTLAASPTLVPVLNATGVILHTNLGRAPLSEAAVRAVTEVARGYSNLELDLATGGRGRRDDHAERITLSALTDDDEDELAKHWGVAVVNNCAAATFLALNSLAEGGEVLVSHGELVEIGGGFRIPEILRKAGVILRAVGTTNRTRVRDYAEAINAETRMILRVHQSNFSMHGFTERPGLAELIVLGKSSGIPIFEDQGTGLMLSLDHLGVSDEPTLIDSFKHAPDLIAASGDKLLGGPQCGLLLGRRALIETIRANPLYRALRVDKLTYAALQATLLSYSTKREHEIPVVRMLRIPAEDLRLRCMHVRDGLRDLVAAESLNVSVVPSQSIIGGGTAPGATLPSFALSLRHKTHTASALLAMLRRQTPPVIARVQDDCVLLDLRTVLPEQDAMLTDLLRSAAAAREDA